MSEESDKHFNPSVRICEVVRSTSGSCGFNLTRSKWDPYPWVSGVDGDSAAEAAGLIPGDCVLEVNGEDVLGEKIGEVAARVRAGEEKVVLLLWNAGSDPQCNPESLCCGPMPGNLQRLSAAMNAILLVLECPICLDMIPPPAHQCGNGHLICVQCRVKSERCPVCRMRFTRGRSLLADQVFNSLTDAFELKEEAEETRPAKLRERIFGKKKAPPMHQIPAVKVSLVNSPKNKFLTRLLGKSSSVENLSSTPLQTKFLSIVDDFSSNLKAKSLSTGEIFHIQTPVSRSPSMSSTHRCGSGFLSANMALGSKRPASYHGSCESLIGRLASDFGDTPASPQDDGTLYYCPCEADCSSLLKGKNVLGHIQDCHDGPLVQYYKPRITVNLPVGTTQTPVEDTSILSIVTEGNTFFLKVLQDGIVADGTCDGRGGVLVWTWLLGSKAAADSYRLAVTLTGADGGPRMDGRFNANVLSLSSMSWTEVTKSRRGVTIPAEYLHRNFANEIKNGLPIKMDIEVTDTLPTITLN